MRYEQRQSSYRDRNFAPVKVGDELDVKIEATGSKGDGIAKKDGFVLFVAGTKQGDEVRVRVTRVIQKVGFAEVVGGEKPKEEAKEETEEEAKEETEDYSAVDTEDFGEEKIE